MINTIDYHVAEFFHQIYVWGGNIANYFMKGISFIAEAGILFLLIGLGLALFKRTRKIGGTILLAVAIGFLITNVLLKNIIARPRPFENVSSDFYKWWLDAGTNFEGGYSFPSGHTTATTAFAVAIFLTTNKKYSTWILLLPIAMASSRIYLMVHYFTDCLGGLLVGTACGTLAYFIIKLIYKSRAKLFVWIQNFDVFKPKAKSSITAQTSSKQEELNNQKNTQDTPDKPEEFVYTTQAEEKNNTSTTNPETSKQETQNSQDVIPTNNDNN